MKKEEKTPPESALRLLVDHPDQARPVLGTPDEGLRMMDAFFRIRNPVIREALINIASQLAGSELAR